MRFLIDGVDVTWTNLHTTFEKGGGGAFVGVLLRKPVNLSTVSTLETTKY